MDKAITESPAPIVVRTGGTGFWAGFRQGMGFMAGAVLVIALLTGSLVGAGWWAFGSVRNFAAASAHEFGVGFADAGRRTAEEARAGLARGRDWAVDGVRDAAGGVGDKARDVRDAVAGTGTAIGDRAASAKDSVISGASGLAARFRRSKDDPKEGGTVPAEPKPAEVPGPAASP